MYTIRGIIAHVAMYLFRVFPLQNKIVFCDFGGKMYGDNPQAIYEEFLKRNLPIKYVWLLDDYKKMIDGARTVYPKSIEALYHLATAKVWIDSTLKEEWTVKRNNQFYMQTWHANIALKKILKDAIDCTLKNERVLNHDVSMTDLMVSGSRWQTGNYRSAFGYQGEILEIGLPKEDILYSDHKKYQEKIRKYFSLQNDTKIVLYVPTFRDDGNDDACFAIDYELLLKEVSKKWSGNWVCLVKLHPLIKNKQTNILYDRRIINATDYPITDELIVASDIVITDYSSCMFSGMEARKRVVLFAVDVEKYKEDRGFYFHIGDLPFPLAGNNSELARHIQEFDDQNYNRRCELFKKGIGLICRNNSAEKVVDEIMKRVWRETL